MRWTTWPSASSTWPVASRPDRTTPGAGLGRKHAVACAEATPVRRDGKTLGADATEADLIAFTRNQVAHYKCPVVVAFVDALPLNASGLLLKTALRPRDT